ncbi:RNA polymerase-binding protein DksA [Streptomyces aurantiacus]|uniref:TraR/DksA family transcriptional regulator n=1 Tax=Streptomyces aurantiacus TaxID=47760 RepID=UPI0027946628|nr:TraR/DksA family transcriptional regulator [Streptomyces aurantiacus]MDQ0777868.1 RNA polymerase-binding protein DksA [Streptomyces aurantiacus]
MVAKKTAVQQSTSGRSTGAAGDSGTAAKDVSGKKSAAAGRTAGGKKTAGGTSSAKRAPAKKAPAEKAAAKEAPARTAATGAASASVKKTAAPVKRAPRKTAAKKSAAEGAVEETEGSATVPAGKAGGKGTRTAKKAVAAAAEGAAQAAETTGATTVVAKKTPGTAAAADKPTAVPKARVAEADPGELAVRPGEDPWTPEEVAEARSVLLSEALRLRTEITQSEQSLVGLMRDSGDGAGDDQADTGTKNITRESEMALAANAREMAEQTERALQRLDAGTYGLCESCGNPIGKARMQAFPRATLCVECKQKQERRY